MKVFAFVEVIEHILLEQEVAAVLPLPQVLPWVSPRC